MNNKDELLHQIMANDFKLYDLQLYLDTHPFDEETLCMYQSLVNDTDDLKEEYEEKYGPLTANAAAGDCEWKWIKNPWVPFGLGYTWILEFIKYFYFVLIVNFNFIN